MEIFLEWKRLTVLIYKKLKFILGEKCAYAFSKNDFDTPFPPPTIGTLPFASFSIELPSGATLTTLDVFITTICCTRNVELLLHEANLKYNFLDAKEM